MAKKSKAAEDEKEVVNAPEQEEVNESAETEQLETISVEEQLEVDLQNEKDKFLRLFAEFENYKKRTARERIELFKTASQDLMEALLPILDDFDRAYS